jgi:hypothetical protein
MQKQCKFERLAGQFVCALQVLCRAGPSGMGIKVSLTFQVRTTLRHPSQLRWLCTPAIRIGGGDSSARVTLF